MCPSSWRFRMKTTTRTLLTNTTILRCCGCRRMFHSRNMFDRFACRLIKLFATTISWSKLWASLVGVSRKIIFLQLRLIADILWTGKTEKVSASTIKLKVNVDGVSNNDCQNVYSSENRQIIDSQVCAGGKKGFDSWWVGNCRIFWSENLNFCPTTVAAIPEDHWWDRTRREIRLTGISPV